MKFRVYTDKGFEVEFNATSIENAEKVALGIARRNGLMSNYKVSESSPFMGLKDGTFRKSVRFGRMVFVDVYLEELAEKVEEMVKADEVGESVEIKAKHPETDIIENAIVIESTHDRFYNDGFQVIFESDKHRECPPIYFIPETKAELPKGVYQ